MIAIVYPLAYSTALVVFALAVRSRLRGRPYGSWLALLATLAYVGGMVFLAHGLYFPLVLGESSNVNAGQMWDGVANGELSFGTLFDATGGLWGGPFFVLLLLASSLFLVRFPLRQKLDTLDAAAIALPFALAIAKIGCLANGCCYGSSCELPIAFEHSWSPLSGDVARLPTQLLDLVGYGFVGLAMLQLARRSRGHGLLLLWFVLLFAVVRTATEFTRGESASLRIGGLTLVQLVVLLGAGAAIVLLIRPSWWRAVWRHRSVDGTPQVEPVSRRFHILVVASTILLVPLFVLLPVFLVITLWRWWAASPVAVPAAGTGLGALAACSFLLPGLWAFYAAAAAFAIAVPLAFERDRAALA